MSSHVLQHFMSEKNIFLHSTDCNVLQQFGEHFFLLVPWKLTSLWSWDLREWYQFFFCFNDHSSFSKFFSWLSMNEGGNLVCPIHGLVAGCLVVSMKDARLNSCQSQNPIKKTFTTEECGFSHKCNMCHYLMSNCYFNVIYVTINITYCAW
jgi:hypothetical protein